MGNVESSIKQDEWASKEYKDGESNEHDYGYDSSTGPGRQRTDTKNNTWRQDSSGNWTDGTWYPTGTVKSEHEIDWKY